jgi:hypothetical protein
MEPNEDNRSMIGKNTIKIPEALRCLIDEPPLLEGEDPEQFWSFFEAMVEDQDPQDILDWVSVIDITIKCWEELRLRRSSAAIIRGGMLEALIHFLRPIKSAMGQPKLLLKPTNDFALKYFSKNPKERQEVIALLAQHGITLAELQAKAAELNGKPLQMFERMTVTRANERRMARKEAQLRTKRPKNDPNLTSDG